MVTTVTELNLSYNKLQAIPLECAASLLFVSSSADFVIYRPFFSSVAGMQTCDGSRYLKSSKTLGP